MHFILQMKIYEVDSTVCGHRVFKDIWTLFIGEDLQCKHDESNTRDAYAEGNNVTGGKRIDCQSKLTSLVKRLAFFNL